MPISVEEFGKLELVTPEDDERLVEEGKKEYGRESSKKYYETHKNKKKECSCKWRKENKERSDEISQKCRKNRDPDEHKKRQRGYGRKFYEGHKEEVKEYSRKHAGRQLTLGAFGEEGFSIYLLQKVNKNSEIVGIGNFRGIRSPEENRSNTLKHNLKGVTALNEHFEGGEMHHMSESVVIFIPKELHQSIWHNLKTGKGMEEINGKALVWAGKQESLEVNN